MANRLYQQFRLSIEKQVVELFMHVTFGASGAVTLDVANSKGVASITKESTAGQYTIVLQDQYVKFLGLDRTQVAATGDPTAPTAFVKSQAVSTTAKSIVIQYEAPDGVTETNPASGEEAYIRIALGNSTAY